MIQRAILAALIAGATACKKPPPPLTQGTSARFSVGQVWTYKTRPSEAASRLIIGRIDALRGETVVHIKITDLALKNPFSGVTQPNLWHAPISEKALASSVLAKIADNGDLSGFQEGYDEWLKSFGSGKGGWFTIPVAEIPEAIEEVLAKASPGSSK